MTYPRYSLSVVWNSHLDAFKVRLVHFTQGSIAQTCPQYVSLSGEKTRMSAKYTTQNISR